VKIFNIFSRLRSFSSVKKVVKLDKNMAIKGGNEVGFNRVKLEELLRKRFFYAPAFSIYGGVAGLYDYGPPGCALQANILNLWRQHFVLEEQMLEVDTTVMTPHDVLKTSGHVDRFTDYMVKDLKTGDFFRADHLLEAAVERRLADAKTSAEEKAECETILAKIDGYGLEDLETLLRRFQPLSDAGNELGPVVRFNLMFGTEIGPTGALRGFLRPETAQGQFTNFKRLLEYNNDRMPFASAQIGKSFRNEISPRSGLLRVREFTMAEIEHYVHPERKNHPRFHEVAHLEFNFLPRTVQQDGSSQCARISIGAAVSSGLVNNETLGYYLARVGLFLLTIGIKEDRLRFRQHMANEMAHYASDCWDAEIQSSYGWVECVGCADRACYDLSQHSAFTGERLVARERLATPVSVKVRKLEIDRATIGKTLKADAKAICAALDALVEEADQMSAVESHRVVLADGREFSLPAGTVRLVEVVEVRHVEEYIPSVIEPSFGIGRIMYSLLEHSYWTRSGDEQRAVLSIPACVAPTKVLLAPLSPHDSFRPFMIEASNALRTCPTPIAFVTDESSTSIGKRYARNDEIGVPFAVTVDFTTVQDQTVTLRERDSTQQIRLPISQLASVLADLIDHRATWDEVTVRFGLFAANLKE
jgi:glycyl-tRNA synthetase